MWGGYRCRGVHTCHRSGSPPVSSSCSEKHPATCIDLWCFFGFAGRCQLPTDSPCGVFEAEGRENVEVSVFWHQGSVTTPKTN